MKLDVVYYPRFRGEPTICCATDPTTSHPRPRHPRKQKRNARAPQRAPRAFLQDACSIPPRCELRTGCGAPHRHAASRLRRRRDAPGWRGGPAGPMPAQPPLPRACRRLRWGACHPIRMPEPLLSRLGAHQNDLPSPSRGMRQARAGCCPHCGGMLRLRRPKHRSLPASGSCGCADDRYVPIRSDHSMYSVSGQPPPYFRHNHIGCEIPGQGIVFKDSREVPEKAAAVPETGLAHPGLIGGKALGSGISRRPLDFILGGAAYFAHIPRRTL